MTGKSDRLYFLLYIVYYVLASFFLCEAKEEIWLGVSERAEQLGYAVDLVTKNRSQLGKYVAACGLQMVKENRLCNGTQRPINLYLLCDKLDRAITEFMDAKVLASVA